MTSKPATEVKDTSATLNATVDPDGEEVTACKFEYGPTAAYGSSVECSPAPGKGETPVAVTGVVSKLSPNTTYHFRVSASWSKGTNVGTDQTFTTLLTSATGETKATDGGLSVEASAGTGKVTIGRYGSNIGGPPLIGGAGVYFQVYDSTGVSFWRGAAAQRT